MRLLSRLPGRPAGLPALPHLQAAFSGNFIWPLSARRVARWARAHGQTGPVAPPDWPRRQVDVDELLRAAARQKGLHHAVHLHLLTAAIGVGDRRIRVLIGADGAILGPRAFSRGRLASATGLLATALVGAGWGLLPARPAAQGDSLASAASGLAAPASAPEGADAAPHAVAAVPVPAEPPDAGPPAANVTATATTITTTTATATAAHTASDAATHVNTDAAAPAAAPAAALALAADAASAPIARIKPVLSDEERQAARQQAAALRALSATEALPAAAAGLDGRMAQTAPATPLYAVVTRARRQHQSAADDLALLRSAGKRLSGPLPAHGELVQNHGEWRAAWWPFANLADAERARVLLAGRGLKAEVVAF